MDRHTHTHTNTHTHTYIYTTEYHLAIKKNKIVPFTKTWRDLKGIMLSEISQSEKDKYTNQCNLSHD